MKRWIHATTDYHNSLVEYRIYELDGGEEFNCLESMNDYDEAVAYAKKYSRDNGIDTHIVACPVDEDDPATKDYFEYDLQIQPYEVVWESSSEEIHASTDLDTFEFDGRVFEKTNYYSYVPENGGLCRNVAAGQISEHRRPYRVAGNYNLYIDSFPDAALPYSIYLVADKVSGDVYRTEVTQGMTDQRQYIRELVEELKSRS